MAVLYLVAWQDTAKPSTHLNPVVVEVCQAVRFRLKLQFSSFNFSFQPNLNPVVVEVCQAVRFRLKFQFSSFNFSFQPNLNPAVVEVCQAFTLRDRIAGPSML